MTDLVDRPTADAVQEAMDDYWDQRAPSYDDHQRRTQTPEIRAFWRALWRDALPPAPADVLDLGTGTGEVAVVLSSLGHRVTGIDTAPGMLEIARERAAGLATPPVLAVGDAVDPAYPPATFDAVVCRYVLWTLRDPVAALERWREVLRPGGRLVTVDSTWFPEGIHPDDDGRASALPAFQRAYDRDVASALPLAEADDIAAHVAAVEAAGFVDVHVEPLTELERLQRAADVDSDHEVRLQHRITARVD